MGIVMGMALAGYADHQPAASAALLGPDERATNLAAQAAFFAGMGLLLSAFVAAVAARIGGLRAEDMHARI
jgi:Pyruvate/2-oxoacid:ferredoxin oxidoreductase gamma subunit